MALKCLHRCTRVRKDFRTPISPQGVQRLHVSLLATLAGVAVDAHALVVADVPKIATHARGFDVVHDRGQPHADSTKRIVLEKDCTGGPPSPGVVSPILFSSSLLGFALFRPWCGRVFLVQGWHCIAFAVVRRATRPWPPCTSKQKAREL